MRASPPDLCSHPGVEKPQPQSFLQRYSLWVGLCLMFGLTWPFYVRMGLFVGYGLSLAAFIMAGLAEGNKGVRELLSRFLIWRVGVRWYLIVLVGPLLMNLAALVVHWVSTGSAPDFKDIQARKIFGNADGLWRFAIP